MSYIQLTRQHVFTLVLIAAAVLLLGFLTWYIRYAHVRDEVNTPASELLHESETTPYTTLSGEPFSFTPYRGKIRIVNVWASWSPFALEELPLLDKLAAEYKERGVVAIAVNRKEQRDRANAFIATLTPLNNVTYVIDETDAFYTSVDGYAMPETLIFDAKGNIVWHYRGEVTYELVKEQLDTLIP